MKYVPSHPSYILFGSEGERYLYDSHTNGIIPIDPEVEQILPVFFTAAKSDLGGLHPDFSSEKINNAAQFLSSAINTGGMFQPLDTLSFDRFISREEYSLALENELTEIVLSPTDSCNLSCRYCSQAKTRHESPHIPPQKMNWNSIRSSVDSFLSVSAAQKLVIVTFYGGEPLLEWPLLLKCIRYVREAYSERGVRFRIVTNGLLLTDEILEIVVQENVLLKISLDGAESLHDAARVFCDGRGSFQELARILGNIRQRHPDYYRDNILCSATYSKRNNILDVFRFFSEDFPKDLQTIIIYVSEPKSSVTRENEIHHERGIDQLITNYLAALDTGTPFRYDLFWSLLRGVLILARKRVVSPPPETCWPNGTCVPATHRLFVSPDGRFYACEKFSDSNLMIGDSLAGIEYSKAESLYNEYASLCEERCQGCWAYRLCSQCFLGMQQNREEQRESCERERERIIRGLERFVHIWKSEPASTYSHPESLHSMLKNWGHL
jgi:uncharacterized protein